MLIYAGGLFLGMLILSGCMTKATIDVTNAPFKATTDLSNGTSQATKDLLNPLTEFTSSSTPEASAGEDLIGAGRKPKSLHPIRMKICVQISREVPANI